MKDFKVVLIDDEADGVESLKLFLQESYPSFKIIGIANSVKSAVELLSAETPDLVFLDIEMPDGSGFDILERLNSPSFNIIFVTAYNQYAIKAFKYSAVDYLLKPFDLTDMKAAIDKVITKELSAAEKEAQMQALLQNARKEKPEKLVIATSESIDFINISDIIHIQSDGNYCTLRIKNRESLLVSKNLGEFETKLEDFPFFRTHQSHIVNLNFVQKVSRFEGDIQLEGGSVAILSRRKRNEFFSAMETNVQKKA